MRSRQGSSRPTSWALVYATALAVLFFVATAYVQAGTKPDYPDMIALRADEGPSQVIAVDVNGDGRLDLVTVNSVGNSVSVLLAKGNGAFERVHNYRLGGQAPAAIAACSLRDKGHPDLVTANLGSADLTILRNDGKGGFQAPEIVASEPGTVAVACGDIDGDGHNDIVTVSLSANQVAVYRNDGQGRLLKPSTFALKGSIPRAVAVADLSGFARMNKR